MSVHDKNSSRHGANDETYAGADLAQVLPKHRFPSPARDPRHVYAAVRDELLLDGNARQNLATFCQTWGEPEVHRLMDECIDKNMVDKDEYPQTAEIEARCVRMLADLWNAPAPGRHRLLDHRLQRGGDARRLAIKRRWEARSRAEGKPTDKPNLVTGPVQVCWHKFTRYWDVEHREIPMEQGRLLMTPEEVLARCDENTIGVVPTLGVTFTGQYEPVEAVSKALDGLQADTGLDIPIHVDGASGGFLAPFCAPDLVWDFRLPRVKSINASGHKFGLAPLGVGWVIWRSAEDLPEEMVFLRQLSGRKHARHRAEFLAPRRAGRLPVLQLPPARPGRLHQGPRRLLRHRAVPRQARSPSWARSRSSTAARWTRAFRRSAGGSGTTSIRASPLRFRRPASGRGWQVPAYALPDHLGAQAIQRILVRQGVSRDLAELLLEDMGRALAHFRDHPSQGDQAPRPSGFHHRAKTGSSPAPDPARSSPSGNSVVRGGRRTSGSRARIANG